MIWFTPDALNFFRREICYLPIVPFQEIYSYFLDEKSVKCWGTLIRVYNLFCDISFFSSKIPMVCNNPPQCAFFPHHIGSSPAPTPNLVRFPAERVPPCRQGCLWLAGAKGAADRRNARLMAERDTLAVRGTPRGASRTDRQTTIYKQPTCL